MRLRPYRDDDLAAVVDLQARYETSWFGRPERDADELKEQLDLADEISVLEDGTRLVALATRWRTGSSLLVDPEVDGAAVYEPLLDWLAEVLAPDTEVLDRDEELRAALAGAGWRHAYSSFELIRALSPEWTLAAPEWPAGVEVRPYDPGQAEALHHLIYVDAAWAEVPGHHDREFAEWQQLFLTGRKAEEAPVLAWLDGRLVGAALIRLFSDGTGWIAQLAVARDRRGKGLGRALLLEGFGRLVDAGATTLGLAVLAANRGALRLYLDVGLSIDREWQNWVPRDQLVDPADTGGSG
jgi:ribosomal protein S18 acetylase RimI-like enzyme